MLRDKERERLTAGETEREEGAHAHEGRRGHRISNHGHQEPWTRTEHSIPPGQTSGFCLPIYSPEARFITKLKVLLTCYIL